MASADSVEMQIYYHIKSAEVRRDRFVPPGRLLQPKVKVVK
jgi:hypothetical protein